jgi:hypothetical protein
MNADTESNVDTARSRAERLHRRGGARPRSARSIPGTPRRSRRWRSSMAFPTSSTSPRRRRSPSRATSSCSGTSARPGDRQNGLVLAQDIFAEAKVRAEDGGVHARQRHVRAIDGEGCRGAACPRCRCRSSCSNHPYDRRPRTLNVEVVGRAKATNAELLAARLSGLIRRDRPAARW